MDELHREGPGLHHIPRLAGNDLRFVQQAVLLQLQPDQPRGHAGGVNWGVDGAQHIGQRANVVLVAVGDEDAPDLGLVFDQVAHVGDDHVDAVHIVVGETHAAVHDNDIVAELVYGHVLADLIQTAKRNNF